ncbi:MAG TPA: cytochrome c [Gemmatimonadaceae bacterium]|nr:cytochrome c [Gemmatimonadaceae bacterium]
MRLALVVALCCAASGGCGDQRSGAGARAGGDTGLAVSLPVSVRPEPPVPDRFGSIGRAATLAEVAAWDIDVNPTGKRLPPGRGTYAQGAALFSQKCAACHGAHGEGQAIYPRLIGRDPRDGFPFGQDPQYVKTIGNYWPYATTVFDYVRRAMPLTAPGSLHPDEIYSVTAFLLGENAIIDRSAVIDARTLPAIRMPARDRFVRDNRTGGPTFR